ncbi:MAG: hypothetical protein L3J34_07065 [Flavobacteriaceae bacterium]|nr:hypothetical protein [Flavobacteriaceae bacterium]
MRKNLINELKNLAEEILLLKEEHEVDILRNKTLEIYDKLAALGYLNKNLEPVIDIEKEKFKEDEQATPIEEDTNNIDSNLENEHKELLTFDIEENSDLKSDSHNNDETSEPVSLKDLFVPTFDSIKEDMSQKEEFKDTISLDETKNLFKSKRPEPKQLSLNDKLLGSQLQIGLNDRIAFVNKLFNFNQSEFNKVLSSLNDFDNKHDAINYIKNNVKPKYRWKGQEELEERLIIIIERKFL